FLRKVVRPLRVMSNAAKEIARGNFDVAIPVAARDEIGTLCESFNSMSQDVRVRTNALVENEEALRRSELQFRTVADFTWDWEFWIDTSRRFLYTSPSCERISGYTPAEFNESEMLFFSIAHPNDRDTLLAELEKAFAMNTQISFDFRIIRRDGDLCWVSMAYQPITGDDGSFLGVRGSLRDVTQRKQMEEEICLLLTITQEIIKAEDFTAALSIVLRKVCDITGWALGEAWIPRPDGAYLECSPAWNSRIEGAEEFRTLSEAFTFPPGVGLPGRAWLSKKPVWIQDVTLDTGFPRAPIARKCGLKTGIAIPVLLGNEVVAVMDFFTTKPCKEDKQLMEIIFAVAAQLGMVIYHKQMEDEMQRVHSLNKQMIAALPSILIYIDENDKIIQWNTFAETILGIASADVVGHSFHTCGIQWDGAEVVKQILDCRYTAQPTRFNDVRFKNRIGKHGFLGITIAPVLADTRKRSRLLLIGNDITQRKILESQLVQAQKLEAIGQLAAGIAHEINTPTQYIGDNTHFLKDAFGDLRKLVGKFTDMLKVCKNGGITAEIVQDIENVEKEVDLDYLIEEIPKAIQQSLDGVDRVAKIVRAMKEFSHPGTNEKTATDLNKAIENTITVSRNEWKYVADVVTVFDPSLPLIPCLPSEFNQVILNIIVNAAHAIADVVVNGNKGIITVSTQRNGNWAEIRIQDTGTGIPEAVRPKIFDPFFTTKPIGKGTGQGLAIAHDIVVRKHGGTIDIETATGKGTTFVIRIPIG
ncbi:MAG: PAS domain S-box protein, partial [Planctomycetota bacterium]